MYTLKIAGLKTTQFGLFWQKGTNPVLGYFNPTIWVIILYYIIFIAGLLFYGLKLVHCEAKMNKIELGIKPAKPAKQKNDYQKVNIY